ncbi:MAG: cytochrome c [Acidobacteriota bacterium]
MRFFTLKAAPAAGLSMFLLFVVTGRPPIRAQEAASSSDQLATLKGEGQELYTRDCASCHGADGTGDGAGPSLDGNTNLGNKDHVLKQIIEGSPDNGMDPFGKALSDHEIAAAATFVRNAWNNSYGVVLDADVKTARAKTATAK